MHEDTTLPYILGEAIIKQYAMNIILIKTKRI